MRPLFQRQILNPMDFKKTRDVHDLTIYPKILLRGHSICLEQQLAAAKVPYCFQFGVRSWFEFQTQ